MSESDSFIDEVAEEVRRDRLFALMRRYGWIGIAAVLLIVGGASWNEWRKARAEASAQAFGDGVLAAMAKPDPASRLTALSALSAQAGPGQAMVLAFVNASQLEAAGQPEAAAKVLEQVAADASLGDSYRQLAQLKLVMLQGDKMEPQARDSAMATLTAAGAPYRTLAMELQAMDLLGAGKADDAAALLSRIAEDADTPPGQLGRVQDILVALGKPAPGK